VSEKSAWMTTSAAVVMSQLIAHAETFRTENTRAAIDAIPMAPPIRAAKWASKGTMARSRRAHRAGPAACILNHFASESHSNLSKPQDIIVSPQKLEDTPHS
jgi:hypothetical protein